ncbi:MAG: hypothetical protein LQ343_004700 [Gyalolechia ehrenbergii]|nr:MAG: hypothetical protein LQ343_004700 [Gyalolechia ehrenbergii]
MSAAVTTRISPITPWVPSPSTRVPPMPSSTTPHGLPIRTPASVGQPLSPTLTNKSKSPQFPFASPGYFTLTGEQTSASGETKSTSQRKSHDTPVATPREPAQAHRPVQQDLQSRFEAFRRQSESNSFNLSHGSLSQFSTAAGSRRSSSSKSPDSAKSRRDESSSPRPRKKPSREKDRATQASEMMDMDSSFHSMDAQFSKEAHVHLVQDVPRTQSPTNSSSSDLSRLGRSRPSHLDERHPRNSLPENRIDPHPSSLRAAHRAETLPTGFSTDGPTLVSAPEIYEIIKNHLPPDFLILDVRVFAQFSQSRISGALNLNLPTTLLKRPTYDVQRLSSTFTKPEEKTKFDQWRDAKFIIIYDANSAQLKDATTCTNTLKKFTKEGWEGSTLIIKGGFASVLRNCPTLITKGSGDEGEGTRKLSIDPSKPVAGGCLMPSQSTAAMPFFSAIRQNQDLRDGVGQIPINLPQALNEKGISELPRWLKKATDERDKGKTVAANFLNIEQAEQKRMQQAYSANISFGSPRAKSPSIIQIAGIEKGTKNRYKDMLPYDHSRVRLQGIPPGYCDYVNASHVKTEWSNRRYIASQAPVPATFEDFWSVTWQQDIRVIVMLTAESEGGQTKCHPYWLPGNYGSLKVQAIGEKHVSLEPESTLSSNGQGFHFSSRSEATAPTRMRVALPENLGHGRRRSTTFSNAASNQPDPAPSVVNTDTPHIMIRKLMLSHDAQPYAPMREITQLQYTSWPDFGTPAHPLHVLGLVEQCGEVIRSYGGSKGVDSPAPEGERPVVVHCSAGCGRTGTFCTVDSVVDMLKRQQQAKLEKAKANKVDADVLQKECAWVTSEEDDLIVKAVEDFRLQRLSMVQTLRQFVLCYEAVLEWVAAQMPESNVKKSLGQDRRSYQG